MKSYLWTVALVFAAFVSVLTGSGASRTEDREGSVDPAPQKESLWDMEVKYATCAVGAVGLAIFAFWVLSKSNQGKKKYNDELRKQQQYASDEEMPVA